MSRTRSDKPSLIPSLQQPAHLALITSTADSDSDAPPPPSPPSSPTPSAGTDVPSDHDASTEHPSPPSEHSSTKQSDKHERLPDKDAESGSASDSDPGSRTPKGPPSDSGAVEADAEDNTSPAMNDSQSSSEGDQDYPSDGLDLRRVKVYELIGSRWTDRGTAFCAGDFDQNAQEARLIARSETNSADILLSCHIRANDVYQRQQDTLIVWTEPDGTDFALSFQDVEGCAEVWDFIVEVQRHLNGKDDTLSSSPVVGPHPSITTQQIIQSGRLPNPQMGIIGEIEKAIRALARTPTAKERICEYIQQEDYIKSMLDVFTAAEDLENLETLHALCSCMQTILLLNDHSMYEHILTDELWLGVVGMLEYDPEFPVYKANYREFLSQTSKFIQPVAIQDPSVQRKIHQTYRLQYLKDVILARALDDSTFNVLNSCIIFNQIDIINHVQSDERFLKDAVGLFIGKEGIGKEGKGKGNEKDVVNMDVDKPSGKTHINGAAESVAGPSSPPSSGPSSNAPSNAEDDVVRRKEVILLVQQLCAMGKNVQLPARIALFRTLVDRGILYAVQWALCRPERQMVGTGGEILAVMLDHDTTGVRAHVLTQAQALQRVSDVSVGGKGASIANAVASGSIETLLQVLCRMLAGSLDLALQNQLADSLRTMLEVPQADVTGDPHHVIGAKLLPRAKDDPGTERFLDNFYQVGAETLFKPILDQVPDHKYLTEPKLNLSREKANLYLYLCDLLCSFALQHSFRSHFFILSSNIASRVASLLSVRDKHLCLAALRFFRICLRLNNRNVFNHLMKHDVFGPVLRLTTRETKRDNLLSSTCQEFFEHMRKENLKDVINHVLSKHEADVRALARSQLVASTFQGLIARWEINNEPPPKDEDKNQPTSAGARRWGQGRLMESEEEDYFNNDDDEEEEAAPSSRMDVPFSNLHRRKRQRIGVGSVDVGSLSTPSVRLPHASSPRASPLSSLLDYDEDDDVLSPQRPNSPNPFLASRHEQGLNVPGTPILAHREIQILPSKPPEPSDPEDDMLESLVTNGQPKAWRSTVSTVKFPGASLLDTAPMRQREKRRRDDDDDDELLGRLVSKNKRASLGFGEVDQTDSSSKVGPTKGADEGPKKLKLKFGVSSKAVAGSPSTARNISKDDDEGG